MSLPRQISRFPYFPDDDQTALLRQRLGFLYSLLSYGQMALSPVNDGVILRTPPTLVGLGRNVAILRFVAMVGVTILDISPPNALRIGFLAGKLPLDA